jgi:serine/threonine protein kinase
VALKKSRVSLKVKRTLLRHEANIMRLLTGHPSIPGVFAYGRVEHFEHLAMELLGRSLGDIIKQEGRQPLQFVLDVADQMVRAALDPQRHEWLSNDSAALGAAAYSWPSNYPS